MKSVLITKTPDQKSPAIHARCCADFLCQLRGLMFTPSIRPNEGLLFIQARSSRMEASIHMLFMSFDIAVFWLDDQRRVVDKRLARRWRPAYVPSRPARYFLETHPDRLGDFAVGDQLVFEECKNT